MWPPSGALCSMHGTPSSEPEAPDRQDSQGKGLVGTGPNSRAEAPL